MSLTILIIHTSHNPLLSHQKILFYSSPFHCRHGLLKYKNKWWKGPLELYQNVRFVLTAQHSQTGSRASIICVHIVWWYMKGYVTQRLFTPKCSKVTNTLLQHKLHWYGTDVTEWELKAGSRFRNVLVRKEKTKKRLEVLRLLYVRPLQ